MQRKGWPGAVRVLSARHSSPGTGSDRLAAAAAAAGRSARARWSRPTAASGSGTTDVLDGGSWLCCSGSRGSAGAGPAAAAGGRTGSPSSDGGGGAAKAGAGLPDGELFIVGGVGDGDRTGDAAPYGGAGRGAGTARAGDGLEESGPSWPRVE